MRASPEDSAYCVYYLQITIANFTMDYQVGDTVKTSYGAGVIVGEKDGFYSVRLWRIPGKSIASSSLAYLRSSTVSRSSPENNSSSSPKFSSDLSNAVFYVRFSDIYQQLQE